MSTIVNSGSVTVTNDSVAVTGTGTSFETSLVAGGMLLVDGTAAFISSVESDTALTLTKVWPGATAIDTSYEIQRIRSDVASVITANDRLADIVAKLEAGTFFDPDAVGTLVDRATYDDEDAGFTYVVPADVDGGTPTVYLKLSATTADWSAGQSFQGPAGAGSDGAAATIAVGVITTLPAGSDADVRNSGTVTAAVFDIDLPEGDTGPAGADGVDGLDSTVAIGNVTALNTGENATVANSGTPSDAVLDFGIPKGDTGATGAAGADGIDGVDGAAASIQVGTVTTVGSGEAATVSNSGTPAAAVFDFEIPQGEDGADGAGVGDMIAADYDPTGVSGDAFDMENMNEGTSKVAMTTTERTKLAGVEAGATADQTGAQIKAAYEAEDDTNAYTDADKTKLGGIEAGATADQTGAEIKVAYEAEDDANAFSDAEKTKLAGIAVSADVTSTNVKTAALVGDINGGGAAITTGIKGWLRVPFACTITAVTAMADQSGSMVVDIWKDTLANHPPADGGSITASAPVTLSSEVSSEDTTLSGWTTSINAGDILSFNVDSADTIEHVVIELTVEKS